MVIYFHVYIHYIFRGMCSFLSISVSRFPGPFCWKLTQRTRIKKVVQPAWDRVLSSTKRRGSRYAALNSLDWIQLTIWAFIWFAYVKFRGKPFCQIKFYGENQTGGAESSKSRIQIESEALVEKNSATLAAKRVYNTYIHPSEFIADWTSTAKWFSRDSGWSCRIVVRYS